eukprot:3965876-Prymnesium_polylepis.1
MLHEHCCTCARPPPRRLTLARPALSGLPSLLSDSLRAARARTLWRQLSFGGVGSSWSEEESADGGGAQAQAEVALQSEVDAVRLRLESEQRALEERRARREADKQAAAATPERG